MRYSTRTRGPRIRIAAALGMAALLWAAAEGIAEDSVDKAAGVLFREGFDDARLLERGWYDGRSFAISRQGPHAGNGCIEYHWKPGTTTPGGFSPAQAVRADGHGLCTLFHQALAGMGLDESLLSSSSDAFHDDRESKVPWPGRQPPDRVHRAAGGKARASRPRTSRIGTPGTGSPRARCEADTTARSTTARTRCSATTSGTASRPCFA